MNLNKVHLIGRMTRDPERKALPSGTTVVKFSVATNHSYKGKDGNKVESVQFHNCVAFGRLADIIGQYARKGQEVYAGGRIEYRQWENKEGHKVTSTEIVVEDFQLGSRPKGAEGPRSGDDDWEAPGADSSGLGGSSSENGGVAGDVNPDDIPF